MIARLLALALLLPAPVAALEPSFDHRYMQGPQFEWLLARDFVWATGSGTTTSNGLRQALRASWSFDPMGDGDEVVLGGAISLMDDTSPGEESVRFTLDARYRVLAGLDEAKTFLDLGLWASAGEPLAAGPLLGLGLIYDFSRNIGVFTSGYLAAAIGDRRVASFGAGLGFQFRYE